MENYHVIWDTQSRDSSESMPLGGHDAGCNVWVQNDELCIYLAQSGTFDENGTMLKLGRLRVKPENSREMSENFRQELELEKGQIHITAGKEGTRMEFLLWQDVSNSNLHIQFHSEKAERLKISFDCWRFCDREVTQEERGQCRDLMTVLEEPLEDRIVTRADHVAAGEHSLIFLHRNQNENLVYDRLIHQQHLDAARDAFPNWLKNRMMGGFLICPSMRFQKKENGIFDHTDQMEYHYFTGEVKETEIIAALETGQYETEEQWLNRVREKASEGISLEENQKWWKAYFEKSFIRIDEKHPGSKYWKLGRNYQLFRYMLGCNYYGKWPTKFNGGLFTFYECHTPDYRNWSGVGFTAQNQRLVYWPMLKSGDFEGMKPQLDFYNHILDAGKARAMHYWGEEGAYFPEQINCFGTSVGAEYKWNRRLQVPDGEDDNPWVRMHYSTALEFALMILEYADYSGRDIEEYLPYIDNVLRFFFVHYGRDEEGKLWVFPSTALETFKGDPHSADGREYGAANPMDVAAGLRDLLNNFIRYLEGKGQNTEIYRKWREQCPGLPEGEEEGKTVYLPAQKYNPVPFNCEIPQLYRVFPYSYLGLTEKEKEIGRNTYWSPAVKGDQRLLCSWHQNGIFAARLNLTEEAMRILEWKLGDAPKRFPVFWGPGHDWTPDHNWGGSGMIGLQEMLIQVKGEGYELLPAWDKKVDVSFRLFMPGNKIVEGHLENGEFRVKETVNLHEKNGE